MKKTWMILFVFVLVACGSNDNQKSYSGVQVQSQGDHIAQGMKHLSESNIPQAIASFDAAIKNDPTNPENYLVLGQVYLRLGEEERAVDTLSAASKVSPNNGEVHYFLATALALQGEEESRQRAIAMAQRSVEIFMQEKDEEKFKQAVILLRSLAPEEEQANTAARAVQSAQ